MLNLEETDISIPTTLGGSPSIAADMVEGASLFGCISYSIYENITKEDATRKEVAQWIQQNWKEWKSVVRYYY